MLNVVKVLIISFLIFLLFGCPVDIPGTKEGEGSIVISFGMTKGRTITPDPEETTPASYSVKGEGPSGHSFEIPTEENSVTVENLVTGQWTISIDAFNADDIRIGHGSSNAEIKQNKITEVTIFIPALDGTGTLELVVKNKDGGTDGFEAEATLQPPGGDSTMSISFVTANGYFESSTLLDSGYYTMVLKVIKEGAVVAGIAETVWIVADLVSGMEYEFEYIEASGGFIIIPVFDINEPIDVSIVRLPEGTVVGDAITITPEETLRLGAVVSTVEPVTFEWYNNGAPVEEGSSYEYNPSGQSSCTISVIATISNGNCAGSASVSVNVLYDSFIIEATAGSGGTISPSGSVSVLAGGNQSFTISPDDCYRIADVKIDGDSVGAVNTYEFRDVRANHTIHAEFALIYYIIEATAGSGGTISPSGSVSVPCGGSQSFTIKPNDCYQISDVIIDEASYGSRTSYQFTNVRSNHTIRAEFARIYYTITATADTGCAITPRGNVPVPCGNTQTFTMSASGCYYIADVIVDGSSMGSRTSFTFQNVGANHTIHVKSGYSPCNPVPKSVEFTTPGSSTSWTAPSNIVNNRIHIRMVAGGGGFVIYDHGNLWFSGSEGGKAGGFTETDVTIVPGRSYSVGVGAGGAAGTTGNRANGVLQSTPTAGSAGGGSRFDTLTVSGGGGGRCAQEGQSVGNPTGQSSQWPPNGNGGNGMTSSGSSVSAGNGGRIIITYTVLE